MLVTELSLIVVMSLLSLAALHKAGRPLLPLLVVLWLLADVVFFWILRTYDIFTKLRIFTAQPWYGYEDVSLKATALITISALAISVGSLAGRATIPATGGRRRFSDILIGIHAVKFVTFVLIITLAALQILHFVMIDKGLLWYNSLYGKLKNPESHGLHTPFERVIFFFLRPSGLIAAAIGPLIFVRVSRFLGALLLALTLYPLVFGLAENSRYAALLLFIASAAFWIASRGIATKILSTVIAIFGLATWVKVLILRNSPYQGVVSFVLFWGELANSDLGFREILWGLLMNTLQATHTVANALLLGGSYDDVYKIGSFSPLPSAVDGLGEKLRAEQYRVSAYVPYNGLAEAWLFGVPWFALILLILFVWGFWCARVWKSSNILRRTLVLVSMLGVVYLFQYPLRNSLRYLVIALLFDALLLISHALLNSRGLVSPRNTVAVRGLF